MLQAYGHDGTYRPRCWRIVPPLCRYCELSDLTMMDSIGRHRSKKTKLGMSEPFFLKQCQLTSSTRDISTYLCCPKDVMTLTSDCMVAAMKSFIDLEFQKKTSISKSQFLRLLLKTPHNMVMVKSSTHYRRCAWSVYNRFTAAVRAYSLIGFYYRTATQANNAKPNAGSRGPLNVSAEKPKFLVDADFQASAGGDVGDEADLSDSSESSSDDDDDDDVPANVPKTGVAEVEDQVEAAIDAAANSVSDGGTSTSR
jgi:hypothetical protein